MVPSDETKSGGSGDRFQSTLWTVVLSAKDPSSADRREALEQLVSTYWKPLYLFVRRRGHDREFSKDLIQGFFAALIEKNYLENVSRDRGRFRTFLLTAVQHFLANEYDRARAEKRGGGRSHFSLDYEEAEAEGLLERSTGRTPDQLYHREWAVRVLALAMAALKAEYGAEGRLPEFEVLHQALGLGAQKSPSYAEFATQLGLSESDVRNRIHRARTRFREAILGVIREYTASEEDCQEELRDLLGAFSK